MTVLRVFVLDKDIEMPKASRVGHPSPENFQFFRWKCYILLHLYKF